MEHVYDLRYSEAEVGGSLVEGQHGNLVRLCLKNWKEKKGAKHAAQYSLGLIPCIHK